MLVIILGSEESQVLKLFFVLFCNVQGIVVFMWVCQVSHSSISSPVSVDLCCVLQECLSLRGFLFAFAVLFRNPSMPLPVLPNGLLVCFVSQCIFRNELVLYNFSIPPSPGPRTSESVALLCLGDIIGRLKARDKPVRQSDTGLLEQFRLLILVCGYANCFSNCCDYMPDKGDFWGWGVFSLCSPGWPVLTV